jgi:hypothetical protein
MQKNIVNIPVVSGCTPFFHENPLSGKLGSPIQFGVKLGCDAHFFSHPH